MHLAEHYDVVVINELDECHWYAFGHALIDDVSHHQFEFELYAETPESAMDSVATIVGANVPGSSGPWEMTIPGHWLWTSDEHRKRPGSHANQRKLVIENFSEEVEDAGSQPLAAVHPSGSEDPDGGAGQGDSREVRVRDR